MTAIPGSARTADLNHLPGLDFLEGQNARREVLPEVLQTIGGRLENYNSDSATRKVLLVAEICIHRNQDIKKQLPPASKVPRSASHTSPPPERRRIRGRDS